MKICILLLSFFCLVAGCAPKQVSEKQYLFRQVLREFSAQMATNEEMYAVGTGGAMRGGETDDKISEFFFAFESGKHVSIPEARSLTLQCVSMLLDRINEDEEIRPYLGHYPYLPSGVSLILGFLPYEKNNPDSFIKYVNTVFFGTFGIQYRQYDEKTGRDKPIFEETYEEALEKEAQRHLLQP